MLSYTDVMSILLLSCLIASAVSAYYVSRARHYERSHNIEEQILMNLIERNNILYIENIRLRRRRSMLKDNSCHF